MSSLKVLICPDFQFRSSVNSMQPMFYLMVCPTCVVTYTRTNKYFVKNKYTCLITTMLVVNIIQNTEITCKDSIIAEPWLKGQAWTSIAQWFERCILFRRFKVRIKARARGVFLASVHLAVNGYP